jgi:hypothetical protein
MRMLPVLLEGAQGFSNVRNDVVVNFGYGLPTAGIEAFGATMLA